ncbi:hypothetical protein BJX63DRAFT_428296 [Aspergillus granulosus]|uniref:Uncharacterized protein n=1 Tax=Aspergillus granulosus TaxID=176169 RepID=A0ABR4HX66_9EURO
MADRLAQTLSARCFLPTNQDRVAKSTQSRREPTNGVKKRGRPRMAPTGDITRMDRRAQVRYAQRTYRHRKELRYRDMECRVAELESTIGRASDSLSEFFNMAIDSDLHVTHPHLFDRLRDSVTHLKRAAGEKVQESPPREIILPVILPANVSLSPKDTGPLGYIVNWLQDTDGGQPAPRPNSNLSFWRKNPSPSHQRSQIERPLPGSNQYTYSFHESSLLRVLQRYCLEYSYRLFSDPHSDPQEFYRVFRLVPWVKYREKMGKYLLCLVRSGVGARLDIPALPFYCIGGAGTHYPRFEDGQRVYQEKMRLPRRILGTLASSVSEDIASIDRQKLLKLAELDGTWLDSNDVVGFLEEKGILSGPQGGVSLSIDLNGFLQSLVGKMVILGRSPGFRLRDVESALAATLRVDSK